MTSIQRALTCLRITALFGYRMLKMLQSNSTHWSTTTTEADRPNIAARKETSARMRLKDYGGILEAKKRINASSALDPPERNALGKNNSFSD